MAITTEAWSGATRIQWQRDRSTGEWQAMGGGEVPVEEAPSGPRALIIEDDKSLRDTIRYLLEQAGYEVWCAPDGDPGLAMLDRHGADIVVVDMTLPTMSGLEVIAGVRARSAHIRIVALTTARVVNHADADDDGAAEAWATVPKPFAAHEVLDVVESVITTHRSRSRSSGPRAGERNA